MNVDDRGRSAARSLWATSVEVDVEDRLDELHRAGERRGPGLRAAVGASVAVAALAVGVSMVGRTIDRDSQRPDLVRPAPKPAFPDLGPAYDVLATDVAPSGRFQAVATLRRGQAAVVLVRERRSDQQDVVWSARTSQELVRERPSRPVAVAWAPDGRRLAVLVARPPFRDGSRLEDLSLLTVDRDGTDRREVRAELARCRCATTLPVLAWSGDGRHIEVDVPEEDGPSHHDVVVP